MTSLRRLKHISKKMSFPWHLWDVWKIFLAGICDFSKIPQKMVLCDFRRLNEIFVKIDMGPLESFKKWNEQCMVIDQVCHEYPYVSVIWLIYAWEFWKVNDHQSSVVSALFPSFSDFLWLIKLYIPCCHHNLKYRNLGEV